MVHETFGVDVYDAKTGDNAEVCVLSFRVKSEDAAKDLSRFLEREGDWVLDSDSSTGEDNTGNYLTFVEIKRNNRLIERIQDVLEIIEKLTGSQRWQFTVGRRLVAHPAKGPELEEFVPTDIENFNKNLSESRYEQLSEFFNSTVFNTVSVHENEIKLQQFFQDFKPHSSLSMTVVKEDPDQDELLENTGGTKNKHYKWLEKMMGSDITVESIGDNYLLTNSKLNQRLIVKINE